MTQPCSVHSRLSAICLNQIFVHLTINNLANLAQVSKKCGRCVNGMDFLNLREDFIPTIKFSYTNLRSMQIISYESFITQVPQVSQISNLRSLVFDDTNCVPYSTLQTILPSLSLTRLAFCFLNEVSTQITSRDYIDIVLHTQPKLKDLAISKELVVNRESAFDIYTRNLSVLTELTNLKVFSYTPEFSSLPKIKRLNVYVADNTLFNDTITSYTQTTTLTNLVLRGDFDNFSDIFHVSSLAQLSVLDILRTDITNDAFLTQLVNCNIKQIKTNGFFGIDSEVMKYATNGEKFYVDTEIYLNKENAPIPENILKEIRSEFKQLKKSSIKPFMVSIFSNNIRLQATIISSFFPHCYSDFCVSTKRFDCENFRLFDEYENVVRDITFKRVNEFVHFDVLQTMNSLESLMLYNVNVEIPIRNLTQLKTLCIHNGIVQDFDGLNLEQIRFSKVLGASEEKVLALNRLQVLFWYGSPFNFDMIENVVKTTALRIFVETQKVPQERLERLKKQKVFVLFEDEEVEESEDQSESSDDSDDGVSGDEQGIEDFLLNLE
ncbi:hypothetical protein EIN_047730 [Entamoeba invadens IP1]|uniref:F-box domain-containing protein n=1 Tax=Entamoeba invadens IP1 TaxID=370355 RepID=A0A0A1UH28_ENTIV|nr:hypothetical protein EIN_047730 [Entamoeba invadens IP1]ELP94470.1 hypothetical protein EIN_047730 [Entamoeba invadens IP1]|eukprot:XP_004261241.1 hypothetical protein EIN_047730 [Entamoeba invadens IP1]